MSILSDRSLLALCNDKDRPLITPFNPLLHPIENITTFEGRTCTGVSIDLHLSDTITRLHKRWRDNMHIPNYWTQVPQDQWDDLWAKEPEVFTAEKPAIILPNEPVLLSTREYVRLHRNMGAMLMLRSTTGRILFEILHAGLGDPDWEGTWTAEAVPVRPSPFRIYPGMRLFQMVIFWTDSDPIVSYADKKGVYQGQIDPTGPLSKV